MGKIFIKENQNGSTAFGAGNLGTYSSPDSSQNPNSFASSNNNKAKNQSSSSFGQNSPEKSDRISPNKSHSEEDTQPPLNPADDMSVQVDDIFKGENTPSPDDLITAIKYEMGKLIHRDETVAKQEVLKNLKQDPQFYSRLNMLNINDDEMQVDENTSYNRTFFKTKKLLDQMISERKKPVISNEGINDIFNTLMEKRFGHKNKD